MIADFINCSTDLMLKNAIISVSVRSHLQTPPQYISGKAGLSSFRRSADSIKRTTDICASAQGNMVLLNEFYGLAVGLMARGSTYHWARPLLATLWSRCRRASWPWLLVVCAPGQQGTGAYHVAAVLMATSFWPPACPFLKHKISLQMTTYNTQPEFIFRKLRLPS